MHEIPSRRLSRERALTLAEQFVLIPGFPNRPAAFEGVADWLCDHCADAGEASALVTTAVRTWGGNWSGLWELERLHAGGTSPQNRTFTAYAKIETCAQCANTGVVQDAGRYRRCDCEFGQATPDEYLETLNRQPAKSRPAIEPAKRITAADFEQIKKNAAEEHSKAKP